MEDRWLGHFGDGRGGLEALAEAMAEETEPRGLGKDA